MTCRFCVNSLSFLDLPGDSPLILQDLALDIRTNCMFTLLKQAIAGQSSNFLMVTWKSISHVPDWMITNDIQACSLMITSICCSSSFAWYWCWLNGFWGSFFQDVQQLHKKETWTVDTDDESGGTTQLVNYSFTTPYFYSVYKCKGLNHT